MNIFEFLSRLENTLSSISVRGKADVQSMHACLEAIDEYRNFLLTPHKPEEQKDEESPTQEVKENGRQSDIGADSGNDSNAG